MTFDFGFPLQVIHLKNSYIKNVISKIISSVSHIINVTTGITNEPNCNF